MNIDLWNVAEYLKYTHVLTIKSQQATPLYFIAVVEYRKMAIETIADTLGSPMAPVKANLSADPAPGI